MAGRAQGGCPGDLRSVAPRIIHVLARDKGNGVRPNDFGQQTYRLKILKCTIILVLLMEFVAKYIKVNYIQEKLEALTSFRSSSSTSRQSV